MPIKDGFRSPSGKNRSFAKLTNDSRDGTFALRHLSLESKLAHCTAEFLVLGKGCRLITEVDPRCDSWHRFTSSSPFYDMKIPFRGVVEQFERWPVVSAQLGPIDPRPGRLPSPYPPPREAPVQWDDSSSRRAARDPSGRLLRLARYPHSKVVRCCYCHRSKERCQDERPTQRSAGRHQRRSPG